MIKSDRNIFVQETEIKPNTYASLVLGVSLVSIVFSWILNEIGLFRVGELEMRIGSAVPLTMVLVPLICVRVKKSLLSNPATKYYIMAACIVLTISVTTLLTFHTTIMLLYPMFVAMLYRSKKVGITALCGSLFCTVFSPILGYVIGAWDIELFRELILIGTNGVAEIVGATPGITLISIAKILLYIVLPRLMMVGSFAVLMFYIIQLGTVHVENQIVINRMSQRDSLTGLYNQNYYKEFLGIEKPDCIVGVIFFDVNGLKRLNDMFGHEYGDLLLRRCAKSISDVCLEDNESGFRLGGDEFLIILENADEASVISKLEQWQAALEAVNLENKDRYFSLVCSMAHGYAIGELKDMENLVRQADSMMYKNKVANAGNRR